MPGFFDEFKVEGGTGGGDFIKADETEALIADETPFTVLEVVKEPNPFKKVASDPDERYRVTVELNGEERVKTFPAESVASRDRLLDGMAEYIAAGNKVEDPVRFEQAGRAILIVKA